LQQPKKIFNTIQKLNINKTHLLRNIQENASETAQYENEAGIAVKKMLKEMVQHRLVEL